MVLLFKYELSQCRFIEIVICDFNFVEIDEQDKLMTIWVGSRWEMSRG